MNIDPSIILYFLLGLLVITSIGTVLAASLLRSAAGLGITSAILTLLMFQMHSPLAAVFELSVCAGLITAIFISTISLTRAARQAEDLRQLRVRAKSYLPILAVVAWIGLFLWMIDYSLDPNDVAQIAEQEDVRVALWNSKRLELFGQILVLLVGVFGVVVLFKEPKKKIVDLQDGKESLK